MSETEKKVVPIINRAVYENYTTVVDAAQQKISSGSVRLRLARATMRLRSAFEEIEAARVGLVMDHDVGPAAQAEATLGDVGKERLTAEFLRKLDVFNKAWKEMLDKPSDWKSPVSISLSALEKDGVKAHHLIALMETGIVRDDTDDEPETEETE